MAIEERIAKINLKYNETMNLNYQFIEVFEV